MIGNYLGLLQEIHAEEEAKYEEELDHLYEEKEKEKINFLILCLKSNKFPLLFDNNSNEIISELYYVEFFDELYVPDPNFGNYTCDDF